jgi:hypothetical protein
MIPHRKRRLLTDETQSSQDVAPVERFALFENHKHTDGMRKASAAPTKAHVEGKIMFVAKGFHARNEEGLRKAYESPNKTYVDGDTEFVAGTDPTDYRDIWADALIPFNLTRYGHRYEQAKKTLDENPQVTRLVGHSLGEATAAAIQKQYYGDRDLKVVGYGSPELSMGGHLTPDTMRFRHAGDPISALDGESMTIGSSLNPLEAHAYTGYTDKLPENAPEESLEENSTDQVNERDT